MEEIILNLPDGITRALAFDLVCEAYNYEENSKVYSTKIISADEDIPVDAEVLQQDISRDDEIISTTIETFTRISKEDYAKLVFGKHSLDFFEKCIADIKQKRIDSSVSEQEALIKKKIGKELNINTRGGGVK